TQLVTESVSCLHDYSLSVPQVKALESAQLVVITGGGMEQTMEDVLHGLSRVSDSSRGIAPACDHGHTHEDDGHHHDSDPHIWLSPDNAGIMASNICEDLIRQFPDHEDAFRTNLTSILLRLEGLDRYAHESLASLSCRDMITFHDGFSYLAQSFDLHILKAIEEESGSEASAQELIELIGLVEEHSLPAIFTEVNGSASAAQIVASETGIRVYPLDMAMSRDYFEAMYHNIDTIKEALG
ncbi:MAG: zinc ABC transporter substrate-binding protein, partial [Oscillospiraceae bacterium]|nr:zinc ABC transporter substrate-binding protein [Oscillospiraceae bacterium]